MAFNTPTDCPLNSNGITIIERTPIFRQAILSTRGSVSLSSQVSKVLVSTDNPDILVFLFNLKPNILEAIPDAARYTISLPSAISIAAPSASASGSVYSTTLRITYPKSKPTLAISVCILIISISFCLDGILLITLANSHL